MTSRASQVSRPKVSRRGSDTRPAKNVGGRPAHAAIRGDVVRKKREAMELSRPDLVVLMSKLGKTISVHTLQQYERGRSSPDDQTFAVLCAALRLEAAEVYLGQARA